MITAVLLFADGTKTTWPLRDHAPGVLTIVRPVYLEGGIGQSTHIFHRTWSAPSPVYVEATHTSAKE
jgi:hypothetical protein